MSVGILGANPPSPGCQRTLSMLRASAVTETRVHNDSGPEQ